MSEDGRRYHPHHHSIAAMSHVDGISAIGPKNRLSVGSCDKLSHIEIEQAPRLSCQDSQRTSSERPIDTEITVEDNAGNQIVTRTSGKFGLVNSTQIRSVSVKDAQDDYDLKYQLELAKKNKLILAKQSVQQTENNTPSII